MSAADPAISIVVVAYRQREPLVSCLRSCRAAADRVEGGVEVLVVDNGELADLVASVEPDARLIEPGANLGFAGAVGRALADARGRWIALVNDDAYVDEHALARLLAAGEGDEAIGSVAAQVRFANEPGVINSAGIEVDSLGIASERLAGRPISLASRRGEVFGATGCVAVFRTAMLRGFGGFDERFFAYLEDVDLAWRARAAGWRCVYEPEAVAWHQGSASTREGSARKYFLVGRNRVRLLARNATRAQLLRALPGIVLYDSAYVLYVVLADRTLAPLRGRLAGLRCWRSLRRETSALRREVPLQSSLRGWREALRQHRAYRKLGAGA